MRSQLTILDRYAVTGAAADARAAIAALAARVEAEGEPGVVGYRFFVSDEDGQARAVIDYATPAAWIGHHEVSTDWPEMKELHGVARLDEVVFLGPMTEEIAAWMAGSALTAKVVSGYSEAAGFVRPDPQGGR